MITIEFETPTLNEKGEIIARTLCSAQQWTVHLGKGISLDLIPIPAGIYKMGSLHIYGNSEEQPQHIVSIKSFLMGKFLVTQAQWKSAMGKIPSCCSQADNLPVERISWNDAQNF